MPRSGVKPLLGAVAGVEHRTLPPRSGVRPVLGAEAGAGQDSRGKAVGESLKSRPSEELADEEMADEKDFGFYDAAKLLKVCL
jgi:hypothetical protein